MKKISLKKSVYELTEEYSELIKHLRAYARSILSGINVLL